MMCVWGVKDGGAECSGATLASLPADIFAFQQCLCPGGKDWLCIGHHAVLPEPHLQKGARQCGALDALLRHATQPVHRGAGLLARRGTLDGDIDGACLSEEDHHVGCLVNVLRALLKKPNKLIQHGSLLHQPHARGDGLLNRISNLLSDAAAKDGELDGLPKGTVHDCVAKVLLRLEESTPIADAQLVRCLLRLHVHGEGVDIDIEEHNPLLARAGTEAAVLIARPQPDDHWVLRARGIVLGAQGGCLHGAGSHHTGGCPPALRHQGRGAGDVGAAAEGAKCQAGWGG
mmetsp:Transcript_21511/g.38308  ORF Transcript_21511/g.38308 Transcript_21511/m.38308 type:complete len:288 (-) Transcript_21511:231-1094(-)